MGRFVVAAAFRAHRLILAARRVVEEQNHSKVDRLTPEFRAAFEHNALASEVTWLRRALRRVPYWRSGHLRLAEISLLLDDVATAYASLQAVLQLGAGKTETRHATNLLAKCYLRRSQFQEAAGMFEKLVQNAVIGAKEDLAACYIGLGRFDEAERILGEIVENERTSVGRSALDYLKGRTNSDSEEKL